MKKKTLAVFLSAAMCAVVVSMSAQTPTPAAKVQRWAPGASVETVGKDQMKVITTDNAKIAVTLVDMWKDATAIRIQVTNLGGDPLVSTPDAFVIVAKGETLSAIPADALSKKIRVRSDHEAEMAGQQAMHYASPNGSGEKDEQNRIRSEGVQRADYVRDSALPAALQPRFQTIGHIYFPYLKKRDDIIVRVTMGGTVYEFPFQKTDIHPAY